MSKYHIPKFSEKIDFYFEMSGLICLVTALLFKYFQIPYGNMLLSIGLVLLSIAFFVGAFKQHNYLKDLNQYTFLDLFVGSIAPKVTGIAMSVSVIGILFRLLHLPGADKQLLIGTCSVALGVGLLAFGILVSKIDWKLISNLLYKAILVFILGSYYLVNMMN